MDFSHPTHFNHLFKRETAAINAFSSFNAVLLGCNLSDFVGILQCQLLNIFIDLVSVVWDWFQCKQLSTDDLGNLQGYHQVIQPPVAVS